MQVRTCLSAVVVLASAVAIGMGCSSATGGNGPGKNRDGNTDNPGGGGTGGGFVDPGNDGDEDGLNPPCSSSNPNVDNDGDGFTPAQGDCNDCDPRMNPGAFDFPDNGVDEDCNGTPDDEPTSCDQGLPEHANNAIDAAKSLGICRMQADQSWGLVAARWVFPDGSAQSKGDFLSGCPGGVPPHAQSRGILTSFGSNVHPRNGGSMVAISSGVARAGEHAASGNGAGGTSPGEAQMCTVSATPFGFPKDSPSCPGTANDKTARDGIALELDIKVPTNAKSLAFDFNFYTFEFPQYYCSQYNDFFVALLDSKHPNTPKDKSISFDSLGNPISVNNAFVEVCKAQMVKNKTFPCSLGMAELSGTGFEVSDSMGPHAATSWLQTKAGVVPGETLRIRFAIWDMFDHALDSTALIDNFRWDVEEGVPETKPIPR